MANVMNLPGTKRQTSKSTRTGSAERLRELGDVYLGSLARAREVSTVMEREIVAARDAGQSLADVAKAAGLSISQIEYVLASVDFQRRAPSL
jgi:DNA-binding ferritin-like protein